MATNCYFCGKKISMFEPSLEIDHKRIVHRTCYEQQKEEEPVRRAKMKALPVTTGYMFEGYVITEYKGIVCGEGVLGTGLISDLSNVGANIFGTESIALEEKIGVVRERAQMKMIEQAYTMGATGIIGVHFDLTVLAGNTVAVLATGTAVKIEQEF